MSSTAVPVDWSDRPIGSDGVCTHGQHPVGSTPRIYFSVLAVVVFGCCVSVSAFFITDRATDNARQERFNTAASRHVAEIRSRIDTTINTLYATRGLFAATRNVDRRQFDQFVGSMQPGPGVRALEWVPRVSAGQRPAYEERARRDGFPGFQITERDDSGGIRRASARDTYYPVYFLKPVKGNESAIGFDLGSDPARFQALRHARDTGMPAATARVTLAQETGDRYGFFVFLPIYRNGGPSDTVRERQRNLMGFALGVFAVDDLVERDFDAPGVGHSPFAVRIVDLTASDRIRQLYPSAGSAAADSALSPVDGRIAFSQTIPVGGRTWRIDLTPSRSPAGSATAWQSWAVLLAGILFTVLCALYARQNLSRDFAVKKLLRDQRAALEEATADLQRSNYDLEQFAYIASHDLKAPLRNIDNLAEWIEEDLGDVLHGETRESMTMLRGRVKRLQYLLDDLLQFSRVGREECQVTLVDTNTLIEEIVDLLQPPAGIEIVAVRDLPEFDTLKGPLDQIFRNLIDNAIKHHDKDVGRIEISVTEHGDFYSFSVSDDGPGIDPKYHERVFQVFKTLKPRDAVEGSGMGLAIVQKQVERRGGQVRLASKAGERGATFEFDWPKTATG